MYDAQPNTADDRRSDDEAALLAALARGDVTPFWQHWIDWHQEYLRFCMHRLGDRHDAEDIVNAGALKVIDRLYGKTVAIQRFRPWLLRILHNLCIDALRDRLRFAALGPLEAGDALPRGLLLPMHAGDPPDRHLYRRTLRAALTDSVRGLPPPLWEVFELRFVEGLSYRDIARRLGITEPNARKRIQRARGLLQCSLEPPG